MTTALSPRPTAPSIPAARLLTATLVVAPVVTLAADSLYAAQGWDDGRGGVLQVLGAIAYGLAVVTVASWLPRGSALASGLLATAVAGAVGNAAYGLEAIHQSFGDVALVDRSGPASVIKPIGLLFPLALVLVAVAAGRLERRPSAVLILLGALAWPVAHIANIASLAVVVNVLLVVGFGLLAWDARSRDGGDPPLGTPARDR